MLFNYHWQQTFLFWALYYGVSGVHIKYMTLDTIRVARFALTRNEIAFILMDNLLLGSPRSLDSWHRTNTA